MTRIADKRERRQVAIAPTLILESESGNFFFFQNKEKLIPLLHFCFKIDLPQDHISRKSSFD